MESVVGMRKIVLILSLVLIMVFLCEVQCVKASPDEIWVPYDYPTIQAAIDAANSGDHIHIVGTRYENVTVYKPLSLIGEAGATISMYDAASILRVTSDNVILSNLTLQCDGHQVGISFVSTKLCHAINNRIINAGIAISIWNSSHIKALNNQIESNGGRGISLSESSSCDIESNTLISAGVYLDDTDLTLIKANFIMNASTGVYLKYASSNNTIIYNTISANHNAIRFEGHLFEGYPYYNKIYKNNFTNATDVYGTGSYTEWDMGWPEGGNYWSDHPKEDNYSGPNQNEPGSDGICDIPSDIDRYPLTAPINLFEVPFGFITEKVEIVSNSTVTNFQLNQTEKTIKFYVTGVTGTGFCRVAIPNSIVEGLWKGNYSVKIDNAQPLYMRNWTVNAQTYIYLTYQHSTHQVIIIHEVSTGILLTTLLIFATFSTILVRKMHHGKAEK